MDRERIGQQWRQGIQLPLSKMVDSGRKRGISKFFLSVKRNPIKTQQTTPFTFFSAIVSKISETRALLSKFFLLIY